MKLLLTAVACCCVQALYSAPAAFWEFEDVPGFLHDSSGNSKTLSNDGGVVQLMAGGPRSGASALFSGSNRLTVPDADLWHSGKFTIEAYFRPDAVNTGSTQVIVSHHNNTGNQRGWHLAEAGGKLRFAKSTDGSSLNSVNSFTLTAGRNYYAAVILDADAGQVTMVLKDLTSGTEPLHEPAAIPTGTYDADSPFAIGATGTRTGGSSFFKGAIDGVRFTASLLATTSLLEPFESPPALPNNPVVRTKLNGYKGIWFELGQKSTDGDKYSGGLGTYTANHRPVAVHAPAVNKTFFTYGGTTGPADRHLLIMAGEYDHATHTVKKPTLVMDKNGVDDPHDNGSITIDKDGYLWVFVSGRNTSRKGFTFRSAEPYSVDGFFRVSPAGGENYTYPQIWYDPAKGFFHLLTRYNGNMRELFFRTSEDGVTWSTVNPLAKIQGHYQASGKNGDLIGTFFNRHPNGNVDARTDLYYMQTTDWGETWTTADGTVLTLPLTTADNPARVKNYSAQNRLMYGIDIAFDENGRPVLFYLTSADYRPGPAGEPRTFHTARWTGTAWEIRDLPASATPVSTATHNYATGSIWISGGEWNIIAPMGQDPALRTSKPMRFWGQGGELERWRSIDQGATWTKVRAVTENSLRNHGYVRKPQDGAGRFATFWADGNPESITESHLYFGNLDGTRFWELPYDMTSDTARPVEVNPPFLRWQKSHFDDSQILDPAIGGPHADDDQDGLSNMVEYARGSNPRISDASAALLADIAEDGLGKFLRLSYRRNPHAYDLFQRIEASENLNDWSDVEEDLFEISSTTQGNVLELSRGHRWVGNHPGGQRFYRMKLDFDE
jgi:hypothetical protein